VFDKGGKMTTTYSFWTLFRNCRMACYWRYIRELVPVDRDRRLAFGSVIHKCLQIWHGTRKLESVSDFIDRTYIGRAQEEDQKRAWHLATALMKAYAAQYSMEDFEVVALERKFEGKITNPKTGKSSRSLDIAGKIDGIVKVGPEFFLLEHKTASQIDSGYLEKLWTDFQVILYSFYAEKALGIHISGVLYNVLVKARLQQGRGETEAEFEARRAELILKSKTGKSNAKRQLPETDEEFQERLAKKYAEPEMFHRETLYISRDSFETLQADLWELKRAFLDARRRGVFYSNTSFCFHYGRPCPYFPLCRSNGNPNLIENLYVTVPPNEELREDAPFNEGSPF